MLHSSLLAPAVLVVGVCTCTLSSVVLMILLDLRQNLLVAETP